MQVNRALFVSVLLSAYNAEKFLSEALDSILNQKFANFELLIADDGSTDNTRALIEDYAKKDSRIKCFHNERNIGKTATVNRLFQISKGDLITIHDADDISLPLRLELQVRAFQRDESLGICGTSFITIDSRGFIFSYNRMSNSCDEIRSRISETSQFHGPTMMMRRSALDDLKEIYRPYFKDNFEDTDLAFRIVEKHKGYNLSEYLYLYRVLPNSLCRKEVDVRNRNLYKVVAFLGDQRKISGADYLMENKPEKLDEYFYTITIAYRDDPARICREAAAYFLYWKLYSKALASGSRGFFLRPFDSHNLRTLFYIIRKTILNSFESTKRHYKEVLQ